MNQCVPADWSSDMGEDAFAQSCGEDDDLIELLWCGGHVVMQRQPLPPPRPEHETTTPWFQYPVVVDHHGSLEEDLFSELFRGMPADGAGRACREEERGAAATPLQGAITQTQAHVQRENAGSWDDVAELAMAKEAGASKRKRSDATQSSNEDVEEPDSGNVRTCEPAQRPTTGKRRRAAQEHNRSERRRRDRINEKMRALQELVPHCNKTDKASMLEEAIEYLKSLQLRVQMMWTTGGGMPAPAPAMFPLSGAHRYMQRMASMRSRMPPFRTCVYTSSNDTKLS